MSTDGAIRRGRSFAQVPDALIVDKRVANIAKLVWIRLDKYAGEDGRAFPSRTQLGEDLSVSRATVSRALSDLAAAGWIIRTRRPGTNIWDTELVDRPRKVKK